MTSTVKLQNISIPLQKRPVPLLNVVLVFGHKACGILALQPGIQPVPPALEGGVLTTGLLGKSQNCLNNK